MEEYSEAKTYKSKPELRNSNRNADYFYSSAKIASHAVFVYNKPWINRHANADICKEIRKLTFRALALRRSESRNCGLCVVYIQREELRYWLVPGNVKNNRIN